jgi:hypothetical protein
MAAVKKQIDPEPMIALPEIQTVYQPPRRPLPKPVNIDLVVSKTTVDEWQAMGPKGRLNAYLQVISHLLKFILIILAVQT